MASLDYIFVTLMRAPGSIHLSGPSDGRTSASDSAADRSGGERRRPYDGAVEISFVKGHGTENDFVLVPDANGRLELTPEQVATLCNRRTGIGGDGVIRVVRTDATDDPAAVAARGDAIWFMDYRNADGSLSEMCGNGIRVLGLYLATHADVDPRNALPIATRDGIKTLTFGAEGISVDMGIPKVLEET